MNGDNAGDCDSGKFLMVDTMAEKVVYTLKWNVQFLAISGKTLDEMIKISILILYQLVVREV